MTGNPTPAQPATYALEPDRSLRDAIGASVALSEIFTPEKIAAAQSLVEEARLSFFDTAHADMETIRQLSQAPLQDYEAAYQQLLTPIRNIKGQAKTFGFPLIARVCGYLADYCEKRPAGTHITPRDALIIGKLVEVLQKAFNERITDSGGTIEGDLASLIAQWRG